MTGGGRCTGQRVGEGARYAGALRSPTLPMRPTVWAPLQSRCGAPAREHERMPGIPRPRVVRGWLAKSVMGFGQGANVFRHSHGVVDSAANRRRRNSALRWLGTGRALAWVLWLAVCVVSICLICCGYILERTRFVGLSCEPACPNTRIPLLGPAKTSRGRRHGLPSDFFLASVRRAFWGTCGRTAARFLVVSGRRQQAAEDVRAAHASRVVPGSVRAAIRLALSLWPHALKAWHVVNWCVLRRILYNIVLFVAIRARSRPGSGHVALPRHAAVSAGVPACVISGSWSMMCCFRLVSPMQEGLHELKDLPATVRQHTIGHKPEAPPPPCPFGDAIPLIQPRGGLADVGGVPNT